MEVWRYAPLGKFELLGCIRWILAILVHSKVDFDTQVGPSLE